MTMLLAHGALGWFDDLIFLGVIILFGAMMFIAWWRSRGDNYADDIMPQKPKHNSDDSDSSERFQLD